MDPPTLRERWICNAFVYILPRLLHLMQSGNARSVKSESNARSPYAEGLLESCSIILIVNTTCVIIKRQYPSVFRIRANCFKPPQGRKHFLAQVFAARRLREPSMPKVTEGTNDLLHLNESPCTLGLHLFDLRLETLAGFLYIGVDGCDRVRFAPAVARELARLAPAQSLLYSGGSYLLFHLESDWVQASNSRTVLQPPLARILSSQSL